MPKAVALIVCWISWLSLVTLGQSLAQSYYDKITGRLCIGAEFTDSRQSVSSLSRCASLCTQLPRCAAFTLARSWCDMFVFDKCSKRVLNSCNCNQTGPVFVKRMPGVSPGALCPGSYAEEYCGVKYRFHSVRQFGPGRARCESDPGLAIMSDVMDADEMNFVNYLDTKYSTMGVGEFFLGGYQAPGSQEPASGWYWVSCNITIDPVVWRAGEPNNGAVAHPSQVENAVVKQDGRIALSDFPENDNYPDHVLCECASPFG